MLNVAGFSICNRPESEFSATASNSDAVLQLRRGGPAASYFLLLRQEKVTKEKATLFAAPFGSSLRCSHGRAAATQGDFLRGAQLAIAAARQWLRQSSPTAPGRAVLLGGSEGAICHAVLSVAIRQV